MNIYYLLCSYMFKYQPSNDKKINILSGFTLYNIYLRNKQDCVVQGVEFYFMLSYLTILVSMYKCTCIYVYLKFKALKRLTARAIEIVNFIYSCRQLMPIFSALDTCIQLTGLESIRTYTFTMSSVVYFILFSTF